MVVYFSMLFIISFLLLTTGNNRMISARRKPQYFLCIIILTAISGLRYLVGTDYIHYMYNYAQYQNQSISLFNQPALVIVAKLSKIIYDDYSTWFLIMACITVVPAVSFIIKRNKNVNLCILLFILLGCWHFSFNLVKQSAAATILFCGYKYIKKRNFKMWSLICVIAALFHISAILMIPIYFLTKSTINKKTIILILGVGVVVFLSYDRLFQLIAFLKQGNGLVSIYDSTRSDSVNILRVLVNCVPLFIYVLFRKEIDISNDEEFPFLFYLSLINMALNIAAMKSVYLYRFCCYTNIYNVLFIPQLYMHLKRNKTVITVMSLLLYTVFWGYDLYKGSTTVVFNWIFSR